jgi:hypothetical protein
MTSISYLFRVSLSGVSRIIRKTCAVIYEVLQPIYLKCPETEEEWLSISQEFENIWNMPHCIGAIDGKHTIVEVSKNLIYNTSQK